MPRPKLKDASVPNTEGVRGTQISWRFIPWVVLAVLAAVVLLSIIWSRSPTKREPPGLPLFEVEVSLRPLATPLTKPQPGDWLAVHQEDGQTFAEYFRVKPRRRGKDASTIYLLLLGDFSREQREVLG